MNTFVDPFFHPNESSYVRILIRLKNKLQKATSQRHPVGERFLQAYLEGLTGPKALQVLLSNDGDILLRCVSKQ